MNWNSLITRRNLIFGGLFAGLFTFRREPSTDKTLFLKRSVQFASNISTDLVEVKINSSTEAKAMEAICSKYLLNQNITNYEVKKTIGKIEYTYYFKNQESKNSFENEVGKIDFTKSVTGIDLIYI